MILALLVLALPLVAQIPACAPNDQAPWCAVLHAAADGQDPIVPKMGRFYLTGAVFQTVSHPELTGVAAMAIPLGGGTWSYTTYDVVPTKLSGRITFQTSVRSGACTQTKQFWKILILACADGGIAQANDSAGGALSFTIPAVVEISPNWRLVPAYRKTKTALSSDWTQEVILGIGRNF